MHGELTWNVLHPLGFMEKYNVSRGVAQLGSYRIAVGILMYSTLINGLVEELKTAGHKIDISLAGFQLARASSAPVVAVVMCHVSYSRFRGH
jgi:hypothetical protein